MSNREKWRACEDPDCETEMASANGPRRTVLECDTTTSVRHVGARTAMYRTLARRTRVPADGDRCGSSTVSQSGRMRTIGSKRTPDQGPESAHLVFALIDANRLCSYKKGFLDRRTNAMIIAHLLDKVSISREIDFESVEQCFLAES
jgi:hypothetical protein